MDPRMIRDWYRVTAHHGPSLSPHDPLTRVIKCIINRKRMREEPGTILDAKANAHLGMVCRHVHFLPHRAHESKPARHRHDQGGIEAKISHCATGWIVRPQAPSQPARSTWFLYLLIDSWVYSLRRAHHTTLRPWIPGASVWSVESTSSRIIL